VIDAGLNLGRGGGARDRLVLLVGGEQADPVTRTGEVLDGGAVLGAGNERGHDVAVLGVPLRAHDHVVVLGDLGVDHRVAAHPQHEQGALPHQLAGQDEVPVDPLLGQERRPGADLADQRHRDRRGLAPELDRPVLAGVAADQVQRLEPVEPVADRPDGLDPDRLADLAHRRHQPGGRVRLPDVVVDPLAGRAQLAVRHQTIHPHPPAIVGFGRDARSVTFHAARPMRARQG
jgi:hypothetical protein